MSLTETLPPAFAPEASTSAPSKKRKRSSSKSSKSLQSEGGFLWRTYKLDIPLAPVHSGDLRAGLQEVLDRWLTRYIPSFGCVLLAVDFDTLSVPKTARILPPGAMCLAQGVSFQALGWRPTIGSKLTGRIMHSTRSNISLIVHNTFNAVLETQHLPADLYAWDADKVNPLPAYQPQDDDFYKDQYKAEEEQAAREAKEQMEGTTESLGELALQQQEEEAEDAQVQENVIGCWVHKQSREPVGDEDGMLEFTVIGLTITNSTVTVVGSLSKQPFQQPTSAALQPPPAPTAMESDAEESEEDIVAVEPPKPKAKEKKRKKKQKDQ